MAQQEVKAILTAEDRSYTSTMKKAQGVTEGFEQKIKSGLGFGALMAIGQKAMNVIGNAVATNVGGAVKRLDTLNNFPKVMQSLGFAAEDASKGIDALADGIDHLPTTLDAVAAQAQQFVPMTGNIQKATDVTLALNNAMAAGGKDAAAQQNAIAQWTKAMAKGKPDFEMWQSMVQTAPAQMDQLAKSMLGATANQNTLYEAMKSGEVSISEVNDEMIKLTNAAGGFDIAGKHYDNFADQAKNASAGIQMSMVNIKAAIQRNLANAMDAVDQRLANFGGIAGVMQGIVPSINRVGEAFSNLLSGTGNATNIISGLISSIGSGAGNLITAGMDIVANLMQGLTQSAPLILQNMATTLNLLISQISAHAPALIASGMQLIGSLLTGIGNQLPRVILKGLELVMNLAIGIAQNLPQLLVTGLNAVTNFINGLGQGDGQLAGKALQLIGTLVGGLIKNLPQLLAAGLNLMVALLAGITKGMAAIPRAVIGLAKKIPSAIKTGVGNLASIGRNLIDGLWGGIKAKFDSVIERVKALASRLPKAVKKVLGIGSPSRVMNREVGRWIPAGLAQGITQNSDMVTNAMANLVSIPSQSFGSANLALGTEYDYGVSARYEVIVPVQLNGREIARATAADMQTALNQRETRQNRKVGIR